MPENFGKFETQNPLELFRQKMTELKSQEPVHLKKMEPEELDEKDREIFETVMSESTDWQDLAGIIAERRKELNLEGNTSQKDLLAYLSNKAQTIIGNKQAEGREKGE